MLVPGSTRSSLDGTAAQAAVLKVSRAMTPLCVYASCGFLRMDRVLFCSSLACSSSAGSLLVSPASCLPQAATRLLAPAAALVGKYALLFLVVSSCCHLCHNLST
jgi:hypothetical protein